MDEERIRDGRGQRREVDCALSSDEGRPVTRGGKKVPAFRRVIKQNETGRYRAVPDDLLDLLPDVALRKAGGTARVLNARKRKHDPSGRFARN
jgi:hypothetical protein